MKSRSDEATFRGCAASGVALRTPDVARRNIKNEKRIKQ